MSIEVHLYHGSRRNRRYVERYQIFHENAYDPVRDVEIDAETGLLQWRSRHGSGSWFVEWLSISSSAERMNDAGGLWMVASGLPAGERLVVDGVPAMW